MKKIIGTTLLFLLLTAGCSVNRMSEEDADGLKPIVFKDYAEESKQANLTNQNNQMIEQGQQPAVSSSDEVGELALIKTSEGNITIKLYSESAPITVANFKQYINNKFYDGTIFHRVMNGFMIQGGGFDMDGNQKTTLEPIKNEAKNGASNKRGTLAMARTNVVDSATAQFFINLLDNDFLNYKDDNNYGYAVFGEVVDGMDIVDKIAKVETKDNGMHQNWPVENIVINSIEMVE